MSRILEIMVEDSKVNFYSDLTVGAVARIEGSCEFSIQFPPTVNLTNCSTVSRQGY